MVALVLMTLLQATPPATAKPQPPAPTTAAPATQTPRPRPATGGATTTALLFITDGAGRSIENVTVHVMGPVDREVQSPSGGATRIEGLRAGTYRVRFTHEKFITFEKEISWRAGTAQPELSVTLNAAPTPPPPPPPPVVKEEPKPTAPKLPPPGTPKSMSLLDFIEKNFISGRENQKENLVGCSGVGQSMLWQVKEPWNGRVHESADAMLYVIAGDGTIRIGDRDHTVTNGSFAVVPRGTTYSVSRRGRNPVIILGVLAGAPCAAD